MSSSPEILIVGAGAAGIGAATSLHEMRIPYLVIEASDRVGGRAYTDDKSLPGAWDQGAHWLYHPDQNPFYRFARRSSFVLGKNENSFPEKKFIQGTWIETTQSAILNNKIRSAIFKSKILANLNKEVSLEVLANGGERLDQNCAQWLRLLTSHEPNIVKLADFANFEDSVVKFPVINGYGTLVARAACYLNIALRDPVRAVTVNRKGVEVTTHSSSITAKAAIITVSTNILANNTINFTPTLPIEFERKVTGLPCGDSEKVAIALCRLPSYIKAGDRFDIEDDHNDLHCVDVSHGEIPIITTHIAGEPCKNLNEFSAKEREQLVVEMLSNAFGSSFRSLVLGTASTNWSSNPFIRGAYSSARIGRDGDRRAAKLNLTERIYWAGEAFSETRFGTVDGAYMTGVAAANDAVEFLSHN